MACQAVALERASGKDNLRQPPASNSGVAIPESFRGWSRQSDSNRRPADYKSAALPTELCRHLRGKILFDAHSASLFLYAVSIRRGSTVLTALSSVRSERTRGYSHRFGAFATMHRLCARSRSYACSDNALTDTSASMSDSDEKVWQTTAVQNLVRYAPSGTYFARFRIGGKLVWKSLKTTTFSVAKQRLPDMLRDHRSKIESFTAERAIPLQRTASRSVRRARA
jgi:hypothetical protein